MRPNAGGTTTNKTTIKDKQNVILDKSVPAYPIARLIDFGIN